MKTNVFVPLFAAFTALATVGAAEKQKASAFDDYPFWTSKKRGNVGQFFPGLTATLQLTASQKDQISAARDEMGNDEGVKAARGISKNDPSITAEQRQKARETLDTATKRLNDRVTAILTPEQKTLIEKINVAYAAAVEETGVIYEEKFGSVKADEAARRRVQEEKNQDIEEHFFHKLDGILSAAQKDAMNSAAKEEEQRRAQAGGTKKTPKK